MTVGRSVGRTVGFALVVLAFATTAQAQDVRARLEARGLPAELVDQVTTIAADLTAQGLPVDPLADKAIEGYAKQVPAARIIAVLRDYGTRMAGGRSALVDAGLTTPPGDVIAAAAEAMGRGLHAEEIGQVARAAPRQELVQPGLTVAAALTAQGMPTPRAVAVVTSAMQNGRSSSQILDLPSTAQAMQLRGLTPDQAGERILRGGNPGNGPPGGMGGRGPGRGGQRGAGPGGGTTGPPPPRPPGDGRPPGDNRGPGGGGTRPPRP